MLSQYSNYDSDELSFGVKKGGLNGLQEFRPPPQQIVEGAGLLVSSYCDVSGLIIIEYTSIIQEPYSFSESYPVYSNTIKTIVSAIKAPYFRVRFRNTESSQQQILKLNTYILPTNPLITLDVPSSFNVDLSGNLLVNIVDSNSNQIQIDTSGNLHTHNIYTSNTLTSIINASGTVIESDPINLGEYKNFDIILNGLTANNVYPVILDVYVSNDNTTYVKSSYSITINYGDISNGVLNCVSNSPYIKLIGINDINLTFGDLTFYMKG